jgi:thioredoxin 1
MQVFLYIVTGVIVVFFSIQLFMFFKMKLNKGKHLTDLEGSAGEIIKSGGKSVFYFYSPNCGACLSMTPVIDRLSAKNKSIHKINILEDMNTARKFGVMGTPSLVVVEDGVINEFLVGQQPEEKIYELL